MTRLRWGLRLLGIAGLLVVLAVSAGRTSWDLGYRETVIAVNLGDLLRMTDSVNEMGNLLTQLAESGATAVTVSPVRLESLRSRFFPQRLPDDAIPDATFATLRRLDLGLYWRLEGWVSPDAYRAYLDELLDYDPQGLIGARAVGVPANQMNALVETIRESDRGMLGWAEFAMLPSWSDDIEVGVRHVFRSHLLEPAERAKLSDADALNRYGQAVRERRVRLVEIRATTLGQARRDVSHLRQRLAQNGYPVAISPALVPDFANPTSMLGSLIRDGLAWLLAVLGPLCAYGIVRRRLPDRLSVGESTRSLLRASAVSALGGLAAATVLSDPSHFLGLRDIPGVRPAMIVPIGGATLWALSRSSWRDWRLPDVLAWMGVGGLVLFALLRSGNASVLPVPPLEIELRNALEDVLIVRPRFKEFLIGHPALILWVGLGTTRWRPWAVGLLAIGMLGQVSIVNSFLHLHTPLWVTLLRTAHGLWMGLAIGLPLACAARALFAPGSGRR